MSLKVLRSLDQVMEEDNGFFILSTNVFLHISAKERLLDEFSDCLKAWTMRNKSQNIIPPDPEAMMSIGVSDIEQERTRRSEEKMAFDCSWHYVYQAVRPPLLRC